MKKRKHIKHRVSFFSAFFHKPLLVIFILVLLPFTIWGIQQTQQLISLGKNPSSLIHPLANYGAIDPIEGYPAGDPPPQLQPDLNPFELLGYVPTNGEKYPIDLSAGLTGVHTPQIGKILDGVPIIVSIYKTYHWAWIDKNKGTFKKDALRPLPGEDGESVKQVQIIGIQTSPGEPIKVPPVYGNPISADYNAMVIFANDHFITLKYTLEDNIGIKNGYAIQIDGLDVDQGLLDLYNRLNAEGRRSLPAVANEQVIGTGKGTEIRVAIRDTGDWLDPRAKNEWWQGVDYPPVPTDVIQNPIPTETPPKQQPTSAPFVQPTTIFIPPTSVPQATNTINREPTKPPPANQPPVNNQPFTPTPTPAPFINVAKTVKLTTDFVTTIFSNLEKLTHVILP